jgi:parallel beta-helix repeat protein
LNIKSEKSKLSIIFLIICLVINGSFMVFNSNFISNAAASSGEPPINGSTTATWYVDGQTIRKNEWINTSDIQINDTGSMEWENIIAEVSGNITVNSIGYFKLTNCSLILNGNMTIHGIVTFHNVSLKLNSTFDGEFNIEVFGSLFIYDLDQDNKTTADASVIDAADSAFEYLVWIRKGSNFIMQDSELHNCGWNYTYPGLIIFTNNTMIENNIISNNYIGVHLNFSSNNILANNSLDSNIYAGVRIANGTENKLEFNTINNNVKGIRLENTEKNTIQDNTITGCFKDGVELLGSTYNTVEHNTISNCLDDGIDLDENSDFNMVSNNTISSTILGTFLTDADNNTIYNNTYTNIVNASIIVYLQSNNNKIIKNRCTGAQLGIGTVSAHGNIYRRNRISSNLVGMGFGDSTGNIITYNDVTSNSYYGIYLNLSSSNNEIHYNNITGHFRNGVYAEDAASLVNATYNWWGSWTGPKHTTTNPGGSGDEVTNHVIYRPWGLFNVPPTIEVMVKKSAIEDKYYQQVYSASDLNGDVITWHQTDNATWLNWSSANQKLYGVPDNSEVGSFWVRINISDGAGGYDELNFTLNVSNVAPDIISSNILTMQVG